MMDNRSIKVKEICGSYYPKGCSKTCPLAEPCNLQIEDSKEDYDLRMNKAAEKIKLTPCCHEKPNDHECDTCKGLCSHEETGEDCGTCDGEGVIEGAYECPQCGVVYEEVDLWPL